MELVVGLAVGVIAMLVVVWFMFGSLAAKALEQNNRVFLELAAQRLDNARTAASSELEARKREIADLVQPLRNSLKELEKARQEAYGELKNQMQSLATTSSQLRSETASLVGALKAPKVRGAWGQVQLKRVVELAGMVDRCDFFEQESLTTENGMIRPDLRIQLPGDRNVVVDSKVPLDAYLEALDATDEEKKIEKLKQHAAQVRARVSELSSKRYWQHLEPTPEFVVLFLPADSFFDAALRFDPALIEQSAAQQVIVATPATLIALLKAVAYGWKQQEVAENAKQISEQGQQVYERIGAVGNHLASLRAALERAVSEFNNAIGSFENRLMVSARRLKEMGAGTGGEVAEIAPIDTQPRALATLAEKAKPDEDLSP